MELKKIDKTKLKYKSGNVLYDDLGMCVCIICQIPFTKKNIAHKLCGKEECKILYMRMYRHFRIIWRLK